MKLKLLSDIAHDGKTFASDTFVDVEETIARHWIELGAAVEADVDADLSTGEVESPQPPLVPEAPTVPAPTVSAPTEPPVEPPVPVTPASQAATPIQGQPSAIDIAATLAATDHSTTQPETPPVA